MTPEEFLKAKKQRESSWKSRGMVNHDGTIFRWEDFDILLKRQENECDLCDEVFENVSRAYVDHDHETGLVRGLLCSPCNVAVGIYENNDFVAIAGYVKFHKKRLKVTI